MEKEVFNKLLNLYKKYKNSFYGFECYKDEFFWEYEFLTENEKKVLPPKEFLSAEKTFKFFRKEEESITKEKFFHFIFLL